MSNLLVQNLEQINFSRFHRLPNLIRFDSQMICACDKLVESRIHFGAESLLQLALNDSCETRRWQLLLRLQQLLVLLSLELESLRNHECCVVLLQELLLVRPAVHGVNNVRQQFRIVEHLSATTLVRRDVKHQSARYDGVESQVHALLGKKKMCY